MAVSWHRDRIGRSRKTPNPTVVRDAAKAAREALEDILRLEQIEGEHRSLTSNQESDRNRAINAYNRAVVDLSYGPAKVPQLDADNLTGAALNKAAGLVRGVLDYAEGQVLAAEVAKMVGPVASASPRNWST